MKGGYQILDLTGATAGSPVEVKGIYKAAAGNNGKPVLILTNDGQRVYAEIAEDDSDFITCYISAEGKTVNITIKSDDSVTTVVSDPGASITGLEQAVNDLNGNKAAKSDITDLECTGTKNTTGNTIAAGRYFYLNGALCKATADIANGATFTLNTNFAVVTIDEELSALNSNLSAWLDITSQCTWLNSTYLANNNYWVKVKPAAKLIHVTFILKSGVPNRTNIITFPSGYALNNQSIQRLPDGSALAGISVSNNNVFLERSSNAPSEDYIFVNVMLPLD